MSKEGNNEASTGNHVASDELPEGWAEVDFRSLLTTLETGSRPRGGVRGIDSGVPSLGGEHLNANGGFDLSNVRYVPEEYFASMRRGHIEGGDILIVKDGATTGKVSLVRDDFPFERAVLNEHVFRCPVASGIEPSFVFWFLWSREGQERILEHFQGSAQGGINQGFAVGTLVPVAPAEEQKRIVAKVKALLERVSKARERLDRVPEILKRFRQSVLAAACSGRLTADWREGNGNSETGTDLLSRLRDEHRRIWETIRTPTRYKPPVRPSFDLDCELPDSWAVASPEELCESIVDCPHSTPKWTDKGEVCLRTTNFKPGILDLAEVRYVSSATYKERIARLEPTAGDVVYSREGGILGIACVIPEDLKACLGQRMMLLRTVAGGCESRFMMHVLNSPAILSIVQDKTGGTSSPHLNVGDIRSFPIPLPPIAEQVEIIKRIDSLFSVATAVGQLIESGTSKADKICQSVLAKAFVGELVETEADLACREGRDYEPASVLLERITAERSAAENGKPKQKKKTAKKSRIGI